MGRSSGRSSSSSGGIRRSAPSSSFGSKPAAAPTRTQERAPTQHAPVPATTGPHASAAHQTPSHAASAPSPAAPSGGGGMFSGLASTMMQGMAFGGGSAIANRAIDGVMGPRTVVHEHQGQPQAQQQGTVMGSGAAAREQNSQSTACRDEVLQFQTCLTRNANDFNSCSFYFDVLSQCKKSSNENMSV